MNYGSLNRKRTDVRFYAARIQNIVSYFYVVIAVGLTAGFRGDINARALRIANLIAGNRYLLSTYDGDAASVLCSSNPLRFRASS